MYIILFIFSSHLLPSIKTSKYVGIENIRLSTKRLSATLIICGDFQTPTKPPARRAHLSLSLILCACSHIHWLSVRPIILRPPYPADNRTFSVIWSQAMLPSTGWAKKNTPELQKTKTKIKRTYKKSWKWLKCVLLLVKSLGVARSFGKHCSFAQICICYLYWTNCLNLMLQNNVCGANYSVGELSIS